MRPILVLAGLALFASGPVRAGTISLAWDAVPGAAGYKIYYGPSTANYTTVVDVGNVTQATLPTVNDCTDYFIAAKAYDGQQQESLRFSNEVSGWAKPRIDPFGPVTGSQGTQFTLSLSGANFQGAANFVFDGAALPTDATGGDLVRLESVSVVSCNEVQAMVTIEPQARGFRAAQVGDFPVNFAVTNPDGISGGRSATMRVLYDEARSDINRSDASTRDRVDGKDLAWLAYSHATSEGQARFNPDADLDGDGQVDGNDLALLATSFGQCWNGSAWSNTACP